MTDVNITYVCQAVMSKVAASGAIISDRSERDNCELATEWMRHEVKAFLLREPRYETVAFAFLDRGVSANTAISLVAANATAGIVSGKWPA